MMPVYADKKGNGRVNMSILNMFCRGANKNNADLIICGPRSAPKLKIIKKLSFTFSNDELLIVYRSLRY